MFFKHFASKPGLSVNGTLVENGLTIEIIEIVFLIDNNQHKGIAKDTECFLKIYKQSSTFQSLRKTQSHDIHRQTLKRYIYRPTRIFPWTNEGIKHFQGERKRFWLMHMMRIIKTVILFRKPFKVVKEEWKQLIYTIRLYPSTFLQPVNGKKNSILNWALNLNLFKSLKIFFCMFV